MRRENPGQSFSVRSERGKSFGPSNQFAAEQREKRDRIPDHSHSTLSPTTQNSRKTAVNGDTMTALHLYLFQEFRYRVYCVVEPSFTGFMSRGICERQKRFVFVGMFILLEEPSFFCHGHLGGERHGWSEFRYASLDSTIK
ncbi:hypothetical protein CEXT_206321 [Caerostris extrusa]|uniref:Uncharacterized protein n=1 Tax=Caerostris extrusa TaxID=172846 RepID=A0AAV4QRM1_CAEEX|nr:hypothetical protein CEXT_206321 [Caerostris extrusa]